MGLVRSIPSIDTPRKSVLPAWQQRYPAFPRLLFVLADTGERAARRRVRDLQAIADSHPMVTRMLMSVTAGVARLPDLEEHGPSGPVWHSLTDHRRARCNAWELSPYGHLIRSSR